VAACRRSGASVGVFRPAWAVLFSVVGVSWRSSVACVGTWRSTIIRARVRVLRFLVGIRVRAGRRGVGPARAVLFSCVAARFLTRCLWATSLRRCTALALRLPELIKGLVASVFSAAATFLRSGRRAALIEIAWTILSVAPLTRVVTRLVVLFGCLGVAAFRKSRRRSLAGRLLRIHLL
jgi:hypothetical protein